mmetsp:Transcript_3426/g.9155  ORF Transcript_3426/g.9155 Transcript_3426/m.9155 type:complete len:204 (-) Transcript_3426:1275-1886(-)
MRRSCFRFLRVSTFGASAPGPSSTRSPGVTRSEHSCATAMDILVSLRSNADAASAMASVTADASVSSFSNASFPRVVSDSTKESLSVLRDGNASCGRMRSLCLFLSPTSRLASPACFAASACIASATCRRPSSSKYSIAVSTWLLTRSCSVRTCSRRVAAPSSACLAASSRSSTTMASFVADRSSAFAGIASGRVIASTSLSA